MSEILEKYWRNLNPIARGRNERIIQKDRISENVNSIRRKFRKFSTQSTEHVKYFHLKLLKNLKISS